MKTIWKKLDSKWQLLLKIASVIAVLTGGGFSIHGVIQWGKDIKNAPEEIDALYLEIDSLRTQVDFLLKNNEMTWELLRENTKDWDDYEYYIVNENDGSTIQVDIRKSLLGNPQAFIFDYTLFPARWSDTNTKFYVLAGDERPYIIYRKNGN